MRRTLALTAFAAVLMASSGAHAGITAVFGGLQPTLSPVDAATCPAPAAVLAPLARIAPIDLAAPR